MFLNFCQDGFPSAIRQLPSTNTTSRDVPNACRRFRISPRFPDSFRAGTNDATSIISLRRDPTGSPYLHKTQPRQKLTHPTVTHYNQRTATEWPNKKPPLPRQNLAQPAQDLFDLRVTPFPKTRRARRRSSPAKLRNETSERPPSRSEFLAKASKRMTNHLHEEIRAWRLLCSNKL